MFRNTISASLRTTTVYTTTLQPPSLASPTTSLSNTQSQFCNTTNCTTLPTCSTMYNPNIQMKHNENIDLDSMFNKSLYSSDDDIDPLQFEKLLREHECREKQYHSLRNFKNKRVVSKKRIRRPKDKETSQINLINYHYFDSDFTNCILSPNPIRPAKYHNYSKYDHRWKLNQRQFFLTFAYAKQNIKIF